MKRRTLRLCAALLLALAALPHAQTRTVVAPGAVLKHLRFLASDELGGRGNGTQGLEDAAQYIAAQFEAAGLQPGGPGGSWFQPFEIVTGLTVGARNRLSIEAGGLRAEPRLGATYYPLSATPNEDAAMAANAFTDAPVVFAGYGLAAPTRNYDDYAGIDVKGAVVLIFSHEPQEHDPKSAFDGRAPIPESSLLNKAMTARGHGARAVVVVQDPEHDAEQGAYTGFALDPQAEDLGIPVLRVHRAVMTPLLQRWNLDATARAIDKDLKPRSRPLPGAKATYVEHLARTRRIVRNVIGVLPGSDDRKRHEAVVLGAHYDHLGLGGRHSMNPELAGQIHNGADDNASGTAAIIEVARAAAARRDRFPRTLVVAAFAGEELGLLGSAHYTRQPTVPLAVTSAMLNLDMVGRSNGRILVSGLEAAPSINADLDAAAAAVGGLDIKRFQEGAGVGSSDDTSFAVKNVPAVGFFSGFHADYHRPTDDWPKIDAAGAARVASLAFELAARLAARADRPAYTSPAPEAGHGAASAGSVGGYGPYFGSVPDFAEGEAGGVRFAEVRDGSPARKAGLLPGDVMVEFDGATIRTLYDFTFALRQKRPGDEVTVQVLRNGQPLTVRVQLTTRP